VVEIDDGELERLGLYDPTSPWAQDQRRLLHYVFSLGATSDEVLRAAALYGLGSLALDLSIRPDGNTVDLEEFVEGLGPDGDLIRRLWLAFGLPDAGPVPIRVTPDAADALGIFVTLVSLVGEEAAFALARVIGSSSARLADSLAGALRTRIEVPSLTSGTSYPDVVEEYATAGKVLLPAFIDAVNAIFRRHLILVSYQMWSTDADQTAVTLQRIVGFIDLVASTEAVRSATVAELATMIRSFEELVWDAVAKAGGRVVKLIGDEAMFVFEDPIRAAEVALDLVARSPHPVRIGLAYGTVVGLFGDFYGEVVNLAARLTRIAEPSSVLISEALGQRLGTSFENEALGPQTLKGFSDVVVFRLGRAEGQNV
jgi:adenylate cyclase